MSTSPTAVSWLPLALALAFVPACDDDGVDIDSDTTPDTTPDAAQDDVGTDSGDDPADAGEPDAEPDAAARLETPLEVTVALYVNGMARSPAGAIVTVDFGDDQRLEATLDDSGRVEFDDPALADQARTITGFAPNCRFVTHFDVPAEQTSVDLALACYAEQPPPETATLSGQATMLDPADLLLVTSSAASSYSQMVGPDWSLAVAADTPFHLVALEFNGEGVPQVSARGTAQNFVAWKWIEHAGAAEDTVIDIDMNDSTAPRHFETTVPLPEPGSLWRDTGRPYMTTRQIGSGLALGFPSVIDVTEDGSAVSVEGEYIDVLDPADVYTSYRISTQLAAGPTIQAAIAHPGYPGEAVEATYPDPPYVSEPAPDSGRPHGLHDELRWTLGPDSADLDIFVYVWNSTMSRFLWYAPIAPGTTAITLPELPSGLDPDEVFGEARQPVIIAVQHCERIPDFAACTRWATSRFFQLVP